VLFRSRSIGQRIRMRTGALRARLRLLQGRAAETAQWAEEYLGELDQPYRKDMQDNTLALVWLSLGRALEALHFLENRQPGLEGKNLRLDLIENLAIQALALQRLDQQAEALEKLQRALRMAEPETLDRVFLALGFELALLLVRLKATVPTGDWLHGTVARLVDQMPEQERNALPAPVSNTPARGAAAVGEWEEPLSEREVEVLRWMARGMTNAQIAEQMVVAESTVKKHINHIFGKLGVETRTQALIRARERGML
jgi:LuxR family transcriptional regulator, maltose regulon positive regulatory protein